MTGMLDQIDAVTRRLGLEQRDGQDARVLVAEQTYDTSIDDVWDALTSAERINRWFLPVSGDLKLGGRYQFEGNAGGTVETCDAPHHLGVTWEFGGQVSWVDLTLTAEGAERTRLQLKHVAHVDETMWKQFGPGAVGIGWDGALLGLSLHLGSPFGVRPEDPNAWGLSEEGVAFSTKSGRAWQAAAIEAGDDEAEATAAADRIIAMYTTPPEAPASEEAPSGDPAE